MPAVQVGNRTLNISNPDKVLYPATGFTKSEIIAYYASIAPVMLPHLAGRALTFKRFPDGADKPGFFEKRCPGHRPAWLPVAVGPGDNRGLIEYCVLDEPAALVWSANLAALELHAPMALAADLDSPRAVVFDFDPGAPAAITECAQAALDVADVLEAAGLEGWCKTSGSKGIQLYVPINGPCTHDQASNFAFAVGQLLERQQPERYTTTMTKAIRPGKIFIDWSQNVRHKTTIAPYSLRAREHPTVSAPVTWDEIRQAAVGEIGLVFEADDVLDRVKHHGDLFAPVLQKVQKLPTS